MNLGNNLKNIRTNKGISLRKLSLVSGVSKSTIIEIENNTKDRNPTQNTLNKLAEALEVPVDEFFKNDSEEALNNDIDKDMKAIMEALKNASSNKKAKILKMIELFEDEN